LLLNGSKCFPACLPGERPKVILVWRGASQSWSGDTMIYWARCGALSARGPFGDSAGSRRRSPHTPALSTSSTDDLTLIRDPEMVLAIAPIPEAASPAFIAS
jgi:hypothetical protein